MLEDGNIELNKTILKQQENVCSLEKSLENKDEMMNKLEVKINKIEEILEDTIQANIIILSELVIGNTGQAVVAQFGKNQIQIEKVNSAKLDLLHDQIRQLATLVNTLSLPSQHLESPALSHPQHIVGEGHPKPSQKHREKKLYCSESKYFKL